MREYLISYDLYETLQQADQLDPEQLLSDLPKDLAQLLALPILVDADGNYLIAFRENAEWVEEGNKQKDYSSWLNRTGFECALNKVNLQDYELIAEEYSNDLEYQSEQFLKYGLFFSLVLFEKLKKMQGPVFKVILVFSIFRYVDSVIFFHSVRDNEYYLQEDFEKRPITQGILMLEA